MAKTFKPTGPNGEEVTDAGGGRYQYLAGGRIWQDFDPDELAGQYIQFKADNPLYLASGLENIPGYIPTQAGGATGGGTNVTRFRDPATGKEYYGFGQGRRTDPEGGWDPGQAPWNIAGYGATANGTTDRLSYGSTQGDRFDYNGKIIGETDFGGQRYSLTDAVGDTAMTAPARDDPGPERMMFDPFQEGSFANFAGKAAGVYGGVNALANFAGPALSGITGTTDPFLGETSVLGGGGTMPPASFPASGYSAAIEDAIANNEQFANNVVPEGVSTDVPSVEAVPDYGYDVPNDPYVAPDPVSPLSPPATPPPSGPATSSGIGGLNNSIYQPVLQSLTDFGVPWEVVQALPSVINSSLQGGALSSLTGGSFGTGAGMGAISSVLGNYLNSKGYNVPTSLLGAATRIIGGGLGFFDGAAGTSGAKGGTGVGGTGVGGTSGAGGGVSPDVLKNALASLQPPQSGASPIRQFLQPSFLNTQGGGSPLALWQGLTPSQTQIRAKKGGSISELSDSSEIHPSLRSVLQGRGYGVDFVPGPENKFYAKHDIRGFSVGGPGTGQSDDIPTMLSDGEYVIDADTVAALGDGSSKAGAAVLDKMRERIRHHKRSASIKNIPPKAKSPLEYLKGNKHG